MGINAIACRQSNADEVKTAKVYALTGIALLDGFISCWDSKFYFEYVRPVTLVESWFDNA